MTTAWRRWSWKALARVMASTAGFTLLLGSFVTSNGCSKKEDAPPVPTALPPAPVAAPPAPPPPPPPRSSQLPAPLTFGSATLGSGLLPDKRVTRSQTSFGPKDTIYVSIETLGAGKATLKAVWSFIGKTGKPVRVHQDTLSVDLEGPATHELHASKKTPWPIGAYDVEVFVNERSVATKTFAVK